MKKRSSSCFCFMVITMLLTFKCCAETAIIVHPSNDSVLDVDTISRMFLGKIRYFSNGNHVTPINIKSDSDIRVNFDEVIHGKSSSQIKSYWAKLVFTGKAVPPDEAETQVEAKAMVAKNVEMISYIDASEVDESVKVVYSF